MLESIIKKLISSSFKLDDGGMLGAEPQPDSMVNAEAIKPVQVPAHKKPGSGRVFGIFPSFVISLAVALIPYWVVLWQMIKDFNAY